MGYRDSGCSVLMGSHLLGKLFPGQSPEQYGVVPNTSGVVWGKLRNRSLGPSRAT